MQNEEYKNDVAALSFSPAMSKKEEGQGFPGKYGSFETFQASQTGYWAMKIMCTLIAARSRQLR